MIVMRLIKSVIAVCLLIPSTICARSSDGIFHLNTLPKGKDVTIPRPATTHVPVSARVVITPTDMPQSISMKPVSTVSGPVGMIRVAIYDRNSERVQYIELSPSTPFVYQVKNLNPITLIPESRGAATTNLALQLQSDKPLQIAH